jgi:hypothetical protein
MAYILREMADAAVVNADGVAMSWKKALCFLYAGRNYLDKQSGRFREFENVHVCR